MPSVNVQTPGNVETSTLQKKPQPKSTAATFVSSTETYSPTSSASANYSTESRVSNLHTKEEIENNGDVLITNTEQPR